MDQIFKHVCTFLLYKSADKCTDSLAVITNLKAKYTKDMEDIKKIDDEPDNEEFGIVLKDNEGDTICRNSPFFRRYDTILTLIVEDISNDDDKVQNNKYYAKDFVEHLVVQWMPYIVMWNSLDLNLVDPNISRISNAFIQSSNRILKRIDFEGVSNRSIADRVRELEKKFDSVLADLELNARKAG